MSPRVVLPPGLPLATASARLAAGVLLAASRLLDRIACRLVEAPAVPAPPEPAVARVEFHAEAGAPEGALYVDGKFIALLPGVTRL